MSNGSRFGRGLYPGCKIVFHLRTDTISVTDPTGNSLRWGSSDEMYLFDGLREGSEANSRFLFELAMLMSATHGYVVTPADEDAPGGPTFVVTE